MVAGRNGARGGGAGPSFRRCRFGFARIPLRFDAPAVVSREFRPGPLRLRAATAHAVGRGLRFDAPAVVLREFRCVSTPAVFSRCGFARIRCVSTLPLLRAATAHAVRGLRFDAPAVVSREFWRLLACSGLFWGGPLGLRAAAVHAVGRGLRFDAPAVVFFEASSSLLRPLLALLTVWGLRRHTFFFFFFFFFFFMGPFPTAEQKEFLLVLLGV